MVGSSCILELEMAECAGTLRKALLEPSHRTGPEGAGCRLTRQRWFTLGMGGRAEPVGAAGRRLGGFSPDWLHFVLETGGKVGQGAGGLRRKQKTHPGEGKDEGNTVGPH